MKFKRYRPSTLVAASLVLCLHVEGQVRGENVLHIDATAPVAAPTALAAAMGASRNPEGHTIGVNSQYLTMDGKPWIPVMGEFHFSRYPEAQWEQEILKMKAAGVQVISAYVIWIHHEQAEGVFNWSGQRDLHRFVELCGKHGVYVYPRVGPWAHAETRNGGFPDWVVKADHVRENDPVYLAEVETFYAEIAKQLKGQLWKDGGPVIGIQIENEYHASGAGKGDEHIRKLKSMAVADGLDVPLYTVTGWDGAAIPLDAVLPVFGGYPDAPWDGSPGDLPPNDIYAFRFQNRSAGNMGSIGDHGQNASSSYQGTPFLTAEVGDGIEDTYFRRPVVSTDDVAAIVPIMLGSGVNMLGYYMFHGGRNPEGGATKLQESQLTGYPTDVPEKSYDFQAPLGEYGQEEPSLRRLKLVHYFLQDFGAQLAPMTPRAPDRLPSSPSDTSMPRISARTSGERGFLFVSNYARHLAMPARHGFQVELALPTGTLRIPQTPIDLPAGCYGIWPVNLKMGKTTLRYSTAQLFKRVDSHGQSYFFFFTLSGVTPEFVLDTTGHVDKSIGTVKEAKGPEGLRLRVMSSAAHIELSGGIHLVLLPQADAEDVWKVDDPAVLIKTSAFAFSDGRSWMLQSTGHATFDMGVFGSAVPKVDGTALLKPFGNDELFHSYAVSLPAIQLEPMVASITKFEPHTPWKDGPAVSGRINTIPLAPDDNDFARAATWTVTFPPLPPALSDAFLKIHYQGDAARLYRNGTLVDDNFWNGLTWTIGLRELGYVGGETISLKVLPLPQRFHLHIENADQLRFHAELGGELTGMEIVPRYQIKLEETRP
jgi:beta-galactosidase